MALQMTSVKYYFEFTLCGTSQLSHILMLFAFYFQQRKLFHLKT